MQQINLGKTDSINNKQRTKLNTQIFISCFIYINPILDGVGADPGLSLGSHAAIAFHQTFIFFNSLRESPLFGQYQIIMRQMCVNNMPRIVIKKWNGRQSNL